MPESSPESFQRYLKPANSHLASVVGYAQPTIRKEKKTRAQQWEDNKGLMNTDKGIIIQWVLNRVHNNIVIPSRSPNNHEIGWFPLSS